jgi:nucleoside-diphosphate-sugar epimerase
MRIVIFGSGGFVGGWLCEELSGRNDIAVVGCVRKWSSAVRLARRGLDIRQIDLEDYNELPRLLRGADVVVNAAMLPSSREPELAEHLYVECVRAGVRRFIQFSSAAVYGNRTGEVDETVTIAPDSDYSRGKVEMESRLVKTAAMSCTQLLILRPSIIYGPFSEGWTLRYVERIVRGRWRGLGRVGEGTCNLIHARDVARAVIAASTADITPGIHVLNINGPDVVSWNEYIERLGAALGTQGRVTPNIALFRGKAIAAAIFRMGAQLTSVRSLYRRSAGSTKTAMTNAKLMTKLYPDLGELNLIRRKVHYSAEKAALVLGFRSSVPLGEGLRQSVAWCRTHGIV